MVEASWWKDLPCPLHPSWELLDISDLDLSQLKQNVDTDENQQMLVETAVYRAFLKFPCGRLFNQGRSSSTEALKYLELAKQHVRSKFHEMVDAEIGYGIIIYTFHMWISADNTTESILRSLITKKDNYPIHECYIHVTQAYFYSRLGPRFRKEALRLYESVLKIFPDNCEWLFGKALMMSREARQIGFIKGWDDKKVLETFIKEKRILQRILELNPDFHLARAFYGQILNSLGEEGAENEISRALEKDNESRSIAMVAVRFYRKRNQFRKAELILLCLLETYNTAEIHFQLGHLYSIQARRAVEHFERTSLWKAALIHFDRGSKLNACHYSCLTRKAEIHALLGEMTTAKALFEELFEHVYKNSPHLARDEMVSIHFALDMRLPKHVHVFSTNQIVKYAHRYIFLATEDERKAIDDDIDNITKNVEKRLDQLWQISSNKFQGKDTRRFARLKLADCNRRLGKFKEAEILHGTFLQENDIGNDKAEILWGLGKCYHSQGCEYYEMAFIMAKKLERMGRTEFSSEELNADVLLSKARSLLTSLTTAGTDKIFHQSDVLGHLERAIEMGSLEACFLFLSTVNDHRQNYFSLKLRLPEILSKIRAVCENESLPIAIHTQFKLKMDDGSEVVYDEDLKRKDILLRVNKLVKYDSLINTDTHIMKEITSEYAQLEALRRARLDFEYELLRRKEGESWNISCKNKLVDVLRIAREILDHVIHVYQNLVLEKSPGRSMFTIHFDWKKAAVDKDSAEDKLKKWIKQSFPGYKMPDRIIQKILTVQPMYDKDNLWLAALGSFNSAVKQKGYVGEETFDLELKETEWIRLKSEDIVRRSCQEVEKLALYFLTEFTTLKNKIPQHHTQQECGKNDFEAQK